MSTNSTNDTEQYAVIGGIDLDDRPNTEMLFIGEYKECREVNNHIQQFYSLSETKDQHKKRLSQKALEKLGVVLPEHVDVNVYGIIKHFFVETDNVYGFEGGVNCDENNNTDKTKV